MNPFSVRAALVAAVVCLAYSNAHGQMIVAHRGASYDAPENTLAAFRLAWQQGADGIEGDFYVTADRQIVCIHDADTLKTAGRKLIVEQSTLAQLRELEYGGWKHAKFKGEPIPTFAEVLATVPRGKTFVIELKSKLPIVPVLVDQLQKADTNGIELVIIAFDQATAAECKQRLPQVKVHWLTSFKYETSPPTPTAKEIADTVRRLQVDGVGMKGDPQLIDAEFVKTLRDGGCPEFHVWTIDSVIDAQHFQQLGAFGITTNLPAVIGPAIRKTQ
jgi:glycerophosphoryl diester phosphodiesterase